jgi:class 3 adenylate cyclase/tetratricopeptide (TPR) repeat protein
MSCPRCQAANPEGAKFCLNCGTALSTACPNCATPLSSGAKFCHNCGYALAKPPSNSAQARLRQHVPEELLGEVETARAGRSSESERRIVTVLFCDVQGSTALAEQFDPEEWVEIMNGAYEYLIAPVYRYEGTLARLMGDAILAFFGAPTAHEDDPSRAVLSGLEMIEGIQAYRERIRREYGQDFNVRVGINTGLVVVGEMGSDLRVEYTAMGDAVNVAARMEQTAKPGTVQITANTHRLVESLFEFEALGGIEVKGKAELVPAFRVLGAREGAVPVRGIEGLRSPLVGRERELDSLTTSIDELLAGRGQIVSVMGEAGLGKSRLVAELRKSLAARELLSVNGAGSDHAQPSILWYEGRSLSYQSSIPYTPFLNLLGNYFGLRAGQTDAEQYERVKAQISEALPEGVAETTPFITTMLEITVPGEDAERVRYLEPPQLRGRVFQAVYEFFGRLAQTRPLVLVFEDLHWADSTSLELLERLMPLTDGAMLMIVALFRSHQQEPSWRFHEVAARDYAHRYVSVVLEPLDESDARALVGNLLHIEDLPERVRTLILKKAEGNPFFVEEMIRSLLDARLVVRENGHWRATREIENIAVPDTLAGVITARLDRLDEEPKRVAQSAAVIGREFQFDVLADVYEPGQVLDDALTNLQRRELIRERSRLPQRVYNFKHVLTQETAYASLLLSKRRELHRRVAECLERLEPERVNEIAHHLLQARENTRALPYVVAAGDRAARAYSTPEAIEYYTRALEILQTVEDLELKRRAYEGLGGALTLANDVPRAAENYQAMLHEAEAHGDVPMEVSAHNKLAQAVMGLGQFQEVEKHLADAERLARRHKDLVGLAENCTIRCGVYNMSGNFEEAAKYLDESVKIGRQTDQKEQQAIGLCHFTNTMTFMTRFDEAWKTAQEAWQVSEELGDRLHQFELLSYPIPYYHLRNGDLQAAQRAAEEGADLAAGIGAALAESMGAYMLGTIARLQGQYERAIACYQRSLEAGRVAGYPFLETPALAALGAVYLEISEKFVDRSAEYHAQALQIMEHPAGGVGGGTAWADIGFCALQQGNLDQAGELFQKGLTVPTMEGLLQKPRYLVGSALVAVERNRHDEATDFVREAREYAEERGMKHFYPLIAVTNAQVSAAGGKAERALEQFARAEALAITMQMRPLVWQARAGATRVLYASGHASEAEAKRHAAAETIDEITELLEDENLRATFVESAMSKLR